MTVIELAEFRLAPGSDAEAILAAVPAMNDWLARQPGFLTRRLGRREDGGFVDVVEWADMASAEAAVAAFGTEPVLGTFMRHIDGSSVSIRHLTRVA